jgi:hypothetical protein
VKASIVAVQQNNGNKLVREIGMRQGEILQAIWVILSKNFSRYRSMGDIRLNDWER